ncbi:fatty acid desaturase [Leisingera aquaemixtae]|uniref:fatty acid desaturase n=1 Tax=Leisingera aquaemixtae TaxID=1396826 RepID=UPI001C94C93E|nr:fatty acid desaturase [Leisingera aquaemixtae]MBY6065342.1 fatty acid desaturase [Leisingera aquaemixtae]
MPAALDHTALIKSLPPEAKAALTARSDAAGLRHLALYLAALAACTAGIALQIPLWPLLMLPQGILLVFLFTLSHECTHQTPFRSKWLNEVLGHSCALAIALPFVWFRYFHLAHHKYTNDPKRDPELEHGGRPATLPQWLRYLSGWGYWRGMGGTLWRNAFGTISAPYLPERRHADMRLEARLLLALYAAALVSLIASPLILWLWIVPLLIGQPFLRAYLLAEHGLCPSVANMLENSRTTFTNRIVRFLAWNMPYHAEHHAFPNVPFHQLPAFHAITQDHLISTSNGYGEFTADYVRELAR